MRTVLTYSLMYSEKGKGLFVINQFKFRFHKYLVNDVQRWVCTKNTCKAYFRWDSSGRVFDYSKAVHNHQPDSEQKLRKQRTRNGVRRKADEELVDTVLDDEDSTIDMKHAVVSTMLSAHQSPVPSPDLCNRTPSLKRKSQYEVEHLTSEVLYPVDDHMKHTLGDEGDTFDIFGKLVACKLRNLPRQQQLLAEKIINDTLFEAEMGFLTLSHRLVSSNHAQHHYNTPDQSRGHSSYHNIPDQSRGQSSSPPMDAAHHFGDPRSHRTYYHPSVSPNAVQKTRVEEYPMK